ncbi:MAG: capsule assembly Wzi family protein [Bacteroidales bacterium]|nr:capsule assembly Wzi family protein [Bacteroidales bacterium]
MRLTITLIILLSCQLAWAQTVYESSNKGVYTLLDELANDKIIDINDMVKPWSRVYIAEKLQEALDREEMLTARQAGEIAFYMKDYRLEVIKITKNLKPGNTFPRQKMPAISLDPPALSYRDSLFAFSLRPLWEIAFIANKNTTALSNRIGAEAFGYYSQHLGIYGRYLYGYENMPLSAPEYLAGTAGQVTQVTKNGGLDYHDLTWGIMYSWRWGSLGVVNDRPEWGSNYFGANILSGRAPAFTQIRLQLNPAKWFEFNYMHGWLGSGVVDSSRSYWSGSTYKEIMRKKYIAANMFSFKPIPYLSISFGNSIIYSDIPVQVAYLVPFLFFRLADYEVSGMSDDASANSQMYFNISSRNIRHLHLYFSMFIDELSVYRFGDKNRNNFFSYKGGFRLGNWPLQDLSFTAEYTYTLPAVYDHYISTNTFASDSYTLGHYLGGNAHELFLALQYKPLRGLLLELSYNFGQHGSNAGYDGVVRADEIPMLGTITWQKNIAGLQASYAILSNASIFAGIQYSNIEGFDAEGQTATGHLIKFSPEIFWNETISGNAGIRIGL